MLTPEQRCNLIELAGSGHIGIDKQAAIWAAIRADDAQVADIIALRAENHALNGALLDLDRQVAAQAAELALLREIGATTADTCGCPMCEAFDAWRAKWRVTVTEVTKEV